MSKYTAFCTVLLLSTLALPALSQTTLPDAGARRARSRISGGGPHTYVATGPSSESDLARLRAAVGKLAGVNKVETRAEFGAVTVTMDGDGRSSQSLLTAAARSAGFVMRPVSERYYAATGPNAEADLSRLRMALEKVYGVEEVGVSERAGGAAIRILGVTKPGALAEAGKSAGFALRALTSYVASGSSAKTDLARLRASLEKVAGVEQVEMQGLVGGATLLIYGEAGETILTAAAKSRGFAMWPLGTAAGRRVFKMDGTPSGAEEQKLRQALLRLDGVSEIDIRAGSDGSRVFVTGARVQPDGILTAAAEAGFTLSPVQTISLPSVVPEAERSTPPDYDNRVLEEQANAGETAPPFTLLGQDGKTTISLSDYVGRKPVVLIFGSCTCPPFRSYIASLERLYATYKDRVAFLLVYIQEAHPGSIIAVPTQSGGRELQIIPRTGTMAERMENVRKFISALNLTIPVGIDGEDNAAKRAYAGWPIRLYTIGMDGRIAYKGAPGPTGFKVSELADWLRENAK